MQERRQMQEQRQESKHELQERRQVLEQRDGVWLDKRLFSTEGGTKVIQISGPLHFMVADTIR